MKNNFKSLTKLKQKIELGREDAVRRRGPKRVGGRGCRAELKLVRVLVFWPCLARPATSLKGGAADLRAAPPAAGPLTSKKGRKRREVKEKDENIRGVKKRGKGKG